MSIPRTVAEVVREHVSLAKFLPMQQSPSSQTVLVLRSEGDPEGLTAAVHSATRELDAGLPFDIKTWSQELDSALLAPRVSTMSLGVLGLMAAMLSITASFGMAAYSVSKPLKELGIRMVLGAQRREILQAH